MNEREDIIIEKTIGKPVDISRTTLCAICGDRYPVNRMWAVPYGTKAICLTCREIQMVHQQVFTPEDQ